MLKRLMQISAGFALATALSGASQAEVVLHRGNGGEPQTLDQAHTSIDVEANILKDLYEGLTVYDAAGNVTPGVAESWTVSDDGLVYTFKLRANAKWSNGDPVTADDFVYSFRRVEDPKEAAGYAYILYPIKNAEAINTAKADNPMAPDQLGMKAVDAKTLEITLERPTPYFLQLMTHQTRSAGQSGERGEVRRRLRQAGQHGLRRRLHAGRERRQRPHHAGQEPELLRAPPNVKIDKVIFYPTEDQAAAIRRFQAGELDLQYQFPADQTEFLQDDAGADEVHVAPDARDLLLRLRHAPCRRSTTCACAAPCRWRSTAISSRRRSTPARSFRPTASCRPAWRATRRAEADFAVHVAARPRGQGEEASEGGRLRRGRQAAQDRDPLQHQRQPREGGDRRRRQLEGARRRRHARQPRRQVALRLPAAGRHASTSRAPAGSPTTPTRRTSCSLDISTNTTFNYGHYNNPKFDELMAQSYKERDLAKRAADPARRGGDPDAGPAGRAADGTTRRCGSSRPRSTASSTTPSTST